MPLIKCTGVQPVMMTPIHRFLVEFYITILNMLLYNTGSELLISLHPPYTLLPHKEFPSLLVKDADFMPLTNTEVLISKRTKTSKSLNASLQLNMMKSLTLNTFKRVGSLKKMIPMFCQYLIFIFGTKSMLHYDHKLHTHLISLTHQFSFPLHTTIWVCTFAVQKAITFQLNMIQDFLLNTYLMLLI